MGLTVLQLPTGSSMVGGLALVTELGRHCCSMRTRNDIIRIVYGCFRGVAVRLSVRSARRKLGANNIAMAKGMSYNGHSVLCMILRVAANAGQDPVAIPIKEGSPENIKVELHQTCSSFGMVESRKKHQ
nr:hypothetical protein L204_00204 [Cryptococcus depauperatus CBS 7855]